MRAARAEMNSRLLDHYYGVPHYVRGIRFVPLYVVVVTSFETMDQIALGEVFPCRPNGRWSRGDTHGPKYARA